MLHHVCHSAVLSQHYADVTAWQLHFIESYNSDQIVHASQCLCMI